MNKTTINRSFIFNTAWQEVLMDYPPEVRLEVYDAIIAYAASGTLPELKPLAKMAFSFIEGVIKWDAGQKDIPFFCYPNSAKCDYDTPQEAFAHLINKVSRKDVWSKNPYVFVYDLELVK